MWKEFISVTYEIFNIRYGISYKNITTSNNKCNNEFYFYLLKVIISSIISNLFKGAYIKYKTGGRTVLQIFQKKRCSPGDHRPKCFMDL